MRTIPKGWRSSPSLEPKRWWSGWARASILTGKVQFYGRYLECDNRFQEAGIAWNDAHYFDPDDHRNACGRARALLRLGYLAASEDLLREALLLDPTLAQAYRLRSEIALVAREFKRAEFFARLAVAFGQQTLDWLNLVNAAEARGDGTVSLQALEEAIALEPDSSLARLRRWRRARNDGDWERAQQDADGFCQEWPSWTMSWIINAKTAFCTGQGPRAISLALEGARRCNYSPDLIMKAVRAASLYLDETELDGLLAAFKDMFSGQVAPLAEVAQSLLNGGRYKAATGLLRELHAMGTGDINVAWRLGRTLVEGPLADEAARDEAASVLCDVVAQVPHFSPGAALWAHLVVDKDPEGALAAIENANSSQSTTSLWEVAARALDALERTQEAADLRERLGGLSFDASADDLDFMIATGRAREAHDVLNLMTAGREAREEEKLFVARAHWVVGEYAQAVAMMGELEDMYDDIYPQAMIWAQKWETLHASGDLQRAPALPQRQVVPPAPRLVSLRGRRGCRSLGELF